MDKMVWLIIDMKTKEVIAVYSGDKAGENAETDCKFYNNFFKNQTFYCAGFTTRPNSLHKGKIDF